MCGSCPHYEEFASDVSRDSNAIFQEKEVPPVYSKFYDLRRNYLMLHPHDFSPRTSAYNGGKELRTRLSTYLYRCTTKYVGMSSIKLTLSVQDATEWWRPSLQAVLCADFLTNGAGLE